MNIHKNRLTQLRKAIQDSGLDGFAIPSNDEFMNEYVPDYDRRLEWLTGFSGSAGMAFVLKNKAVFFTDGRYMLQAAEQLPKGEYEILNTSDVKPSLWLKENLGAGKTLGINPMLYSNSGVAKYQESCRVKPCADLIDIIWEDKPSKPASVIKVHPTKYTGKTHNAKIKEITQHIKNNNADMLLVTAPDSICWLLNIRGADVPNTPLVLARLVLEASGAGLLFVDCDEKKLLKHLGAKIKIRPLEELSKYLHKTAGKKILLDKNSAPYLFFDELSKNNTVIDMADPCTLPKACKNNVEVEGAIDAHVRDGVAVTSFLCWLKKNYKKKKVTEISLAEKLLEFRQKDSLFAEPSFDTIAGFASNGAIVHYRASDKSSKTISGNNILLLDSGGQYLSGTTDITRTIAIGKPTKEQKRNFTLVLKGHIAIATAVFPKGTSGHQIDVLARQYLWQNGLDYDHGTGHGVGSFLGVHEGPQRISKAPNEVALQPGMIISNEPGYYKNGEYGIRIESLVVVEEVPNKNNTKHFFLFRTLTVVPIDPDLVEFALLDISEKKWLLEYHTYINKILLACGKKNSAYLPIEKETSLWLQDILAIYKKNIPILAQ